MTFRKNFWGKERRVSKDKNTDESGCEHINSPLYFAIDVLLYDFATPDASSGSQFLMWN